MRKTVGGFYRKDKETSAAVDILPESTKKTGEKTKKNQLNRTICTIKLM